MEAFSPCTCEDLRSHRNDHCVNHVEGGRGLCLVCLQVCEQPSEE